MNRNALKEIRSFGFSDEELRRDFHISNQTLINYSSKQTKRTKENRISAPSLKLDMLSFVLKTMRSMFPGLNPKTELKHLMVEDETLLEFVNNHVTPKENMELIRKLLRISIESQLKEKTIERSVDKFRKKYIHINQETLETASIETPELVEGIVVDDKLTPLVRSYALFALAQTHNEEYFQLIKAYIHHDSPIMRESAYLGLFEHYDIENEEHSELKELFKSMLENEKAPGVRERVASLLSEM